MGGFLYFREKYSRINETVGVNERYYKEEVYVRLEIFKGKP
jgi:hypothetical protein